MREMHPYLVELEDLSAQQGTKIHDVFQGAVIGNFTVLAPSATGTSNSFRTLAKRRNVALRTSCWAAFSLKP